MIVNKDKSVKLNIFVKFIPIIVYYVLWTIDVNWINGIHGIMDIVSGLFAGTFSLFTECWGFAFFEVFLFVSPKGTAKTVMAIISMILSSLSAGWMYLLTEFIFSFAGFWRPTLVAIICMNIVYIVVAALILAGKVRT
ncbi:MAG: hypothetical protein J6U41_02535 [Lachnospiraceae bacterium]|nr:hypothetical protein [Lachnospiraceae bacterium]MBO7531611.1 hypothetical protein [Lachnospiraceae bacterium]MBP5252937.1 hypothetical protein [Lachnospiraceae bacterium]MBP5472117.1 hypothetical protein [Lachnospiraceae bacterium]MBP5702067.1 hypothetical protein [Lachnospiraceae bacterium]